MRYCAILIMVLALVTLAGCASNSPNAKVLSMDIAIVADHNATVRGPVNQSKPITTTDSLKGGMTP